MRRISVKLSYDEGPKLVLAAVRRSNGLDQLILKMGDGECLFHHRLEKPILVPEVIVDAGSFDPAPSQISRIDVFANPLLVKRFLASRRIVSRVGLLVFLSAFIRRPCRLCLGAANEG